MSTRTEVDRGVPRPPAGSALRGVVALAVLGVVTAFPACGDESAREVAGSPGVFQPLADTAAPTLEAREAVRIGGGEGGGGEVAFQAVTDLVLGPGGRVWVLDGPAGRVVTLDAEGGLERDFGGQGDGPGEFTVAGGFGFVGDTLWVIDAFSRRTTFFSLEGDVLATTVDTVTVDPVRFRNPARPSAYMSDGSMVAVPAPLDLGIDEEAPVLRVDRTARTRDTLVLRSAWTRSVPVPSGSFAFNPLSDHALVSVEAWGRWLVVVERPGVSAAEEDQLAVRVHRVEAGDSLAFDVRYSVAGEPVTEAERDSVLEAGTERLRANMESISELRESIDDPRAVVEEVLRIPAFHPPVTRLVAASDGTTWLGRRPVGDGFRLWTVLTAEGSVLRHVRVPLTVEVRDAREDRIWGIATDELGVQRVVGLDVVPVGAP